MEKVDKKVDMMMKCRSIFLYNIGLIYEDFTLLDNEYLYVLLKGFLEDFIESNFDTFNLIYYFKMDGNDLIIYEEPEWLEILDKNLDYLRNHDVNNINKLYDDVGYKKIAKLTELVTLFYSYVMTLNDMNKARIRN